MKKLLLILLLGLSAYYSQGQTLRINKYLVDSVVGGEHILFLDTTHTGQWKDISNQAGGGGGGAGTVTSVGSGYGILGGPIISSGTLRVDTTTLKGLWDSAYVRMNSINSTNVAFIRYDGTQDTLTFISGVAWGDLTGTLSNQIDLQNALNLKANLASPTFTGTVTIPTPFTLGAVSVTSTGTQLNYLNAATGTTGTASTNIVFSGSPTIVTPMIASFTNATHNHTNAAGGGQITDAALSAAVGVAKGGTGASSISALSIWVANSANTIAEVTPSAGQSVRINAGGTAWEAYTPGSGGGDVTKVGTPVDNQIGIWTGDGTIEGDANLTYSGSLLTLGGANSNKAYFSDVSDVATVASNYDPVAGTVTVSTKAASMIKLTGTTSDGSIGFYTTTTNNVTPTLFMSLSKDGRLGLGNTNNTFTLDVTGTFRTTNSANIQGGLQVLGALSAPTGSGGFELEYSGGTAYVTAFNRNSSTWVPMNLRGSTVDVTNSGTLAARFSSGNLLIGGTSVAASAVSALELFNGTAPTGSVTNGVVIYSEDVAASAELKVRDEAGNITVLSPHNFSGIPDGKSEEMAWAFYSERDGKYINVDMLRLARLVEKLSGEKLIYIGDRKE